MLSTKVPAHPKKRALGLLDRARKRLHRRSYWRRLTSRFPINGLSLIELSEHLDSTLGAAWPAQAATLLPALSLRANTVFYHHHSLGSVPAELADQLRRALGPDTALVPGADALFAEGLAVITRGPSQANRVALIISPHQDDAALSIGGLMACRADLEAHLVLNVFTVSAWLGEGFPTAPVEEVSSLRQLEEALCNRVLGARGCSMQMWEAEVRNYHRRAVDNYPVREGFVFANDPDLRTLGERDSITRGILQAVERLRPTRIYFPLGLGSHVDHVYLRNAGVALAPRLASSDCEVFFYEDQPYATYEQVDAVTEVELLQSKRRRLDAHYVDISEHFEQKMQAIAAHRSQFHRGENQERLQGYAQEVASRAGMPRALAERIWRYQAL